jgi:hypothetical protein
MFSELLSIGPKATADSTGVQVEWCTTFHCFHVIPMCQFVTNHTTSITNHTNHNLCCCIKHPKYQWSSHHGTDEEENFQ